MAPPSLQQIASCENEAFQFCQTFTQMLAASLCPSSSGCKTCRTLSALSKTSVEHLIEAIAFECADLWWYQLFLLPDPAFVQHAPHAFAAMQVVREVCQ
jgi:hypothetical protein